MSHCVLDATLLITLGSAQALEVLTRSRLHSWHITPIVRGELRSDVTRRGAERAILEGSIATADLDLANDGEAAAWARWSRLVDPGEAEAIALAEVRGWKVAIEDLRARRAIDRELGVGRWLNCANLLLDGIRTRRLSEAEADAIFQGLDCYSSYVKRGVTSLGQLGR